ncbi:MAG: lytic transglycosylase domain-containing protein [Verrucomicrobia bacterium]|nr:lytic transglycosylase domain-containing protein [Verrucomicrobiota bacterium]
MKTIWRWALWTAVIAGAIALLEWWRWVRRECSQDRPILAASERYGVEPALVKAVVWRESRFDPLAKGRRGEVGLMQIMEGTAHEWAAAEGLKLFYHRQLFDPWRNTQAGAWYLAKLRRRYQHTDNPLPYTLADYNAGRGNVLRWAKGAAATNSVAFIEAIGFPGTKQYVRTALARFERYRKTFPPKSRSRRKSRPPCI